MRSSLDVFVEKGIDGARVDDLARAAGFTRGAFYSNFSTKEEVFVALFASVTEELVGIANSAVDTAISEATVGAAHGEEDIDDAAVMVAVFEAIRPFGRQWYLLYSDAIARSLRDEHLREQVGAQRERLRTAIGEMLSRKFDELGDQPLLDPPDLAQLLVGIFIDLMVREQMDGRDVTDLAAITILGTLHAFVVPGDPSRSPSDPATLVARRLSREATSNRAVSTDDTPSSPRS